jgi:cation diffusion facilitator family transporter
VGTQVPRSHINLKMEIQRQKTSVALLSVASNTVLVTLKLITGLLTGSISVLSEAAHSSMDLIASIIAFFAVRISARRPDAEHPFGHGKVEDISALAEALLIVIAAIWIVVEAIHKIIAPQPLATVDWGIAVMLFSVVANIVVSQLLFIVGKRTDSPALIADAWHLRTDVWTSAGVLTGLAIIWVGARLWPEVNLSWIDPTAAIVVAILILRAALDLTMTAIKDLIDTSPPAHELYWLSGYLESWYPTVRSIHRIRTRKSGAARFIDLHIVGDPAMTVSDSHAITEKMTAAVREKLSGADLTVHIEPCDGLCKKSCVSGCMLPTDERMHIQQAASAAVKKARKMV